MDENFTLALTFTLKEEGGFVDNPDDDGGPTNMGVTQVVYDEFTGSGKPVSELSLEEATQIYRTKFWNLASCSRLAKPLDIVHFDWSVSHGLPQANISLQACFGAHPQDGIVGPETMAVIESYAVLEACSLYIQYRRNWCNAQVVRKPTQEQFLADWLGRCDRLQTYINKLMT